MCIRAPVVRCKMCYRHASESSQNVPNVDTRWHMLCISFHGRMCVQYDGNGEFWKEDAKAFSAMSCPEMNAPFITNVGMLLELFSD